MKCILFQVLSCRSETQSELVQQVVSFVLHGKQRGISEVCNYLRPLLMFSVVRTCSSDSSLSSFLSLVISSLTSLCCSLVNGLSPLFEMLICCLCCFVLRDMEVSPIELEFLVTLITFDALDLFFITNKDKLTYI